MSIGNGVQDLAGLVDYQDGTVVSRQLLKTTGGSVTCFAFDRGEGLSEHSTPHEALLQVVDGHARVEVSGVSHRVATGQVLRLPAAEPHAVQAEERFKMILVMLRRGG
jgi:quercetin dioxygenase-like cupin family protein